MRLVGLALLLGGCDIVLGLDAPPTLPPLEGESKTHDEDGDGRADALDLCPHLDAQENSDIDRDGIGDGCDPRPTTPDDRYFISFERGETGVLVPAGTFAAETDAIVLGKLASGQSWLTLALEAGTVNLEAEIEVLDHADVSEGGYVELGFFAVSRTPPIDTSMRGDNCFLGANQSTPMYFEFNNDDADIPVDALFDDPLANQRGRLTMTRTPSEIHCVLKTAQRTYTGGGPHNDVPRNLFGDVVVAAERARVRLRYLFVVTPRP